MNSILVQLSVVHSMKKDANFDLDKIRTEFEGNGISHELDEMDYLMINSRRRRIFHDPWKIGVSNPTPTSDERMQQDIDKARNILANMRPLSNRQHCVFCRNNKEDYRVYSTHTIKDDKGRVTCPILSRYSCPMCGATGANAHTIKYCPYNDGIGAVDSLFRTPRNGAGKHRKQACSSDASLMLV